MISIQECCSRTFNGALRGLNVGYVMVLGANVAQGVTNMGTAILGQPHVSIYGPAMNSVTLVATTTAGAVAGAIGMNSVSAAQVTGVAALIVTQGGWHESIPNIISVAGEQIRTTVSQYQLSSLVTLPIQFLVARLRAHI